MSTQTISSPRVLVIVWLLILSIAGYYLRVHGVDEYYFSPDELQHIAISKAPTVKEVMAFSQFETHPSYPQILRHYLLNISDEAWFLRGESVVFGLLCILVYYFLGKQQNGRLTGCIAASLIAFGYGSIQQSQVVRSYELLALILGIAFYFYQAFLRNKENCHLALYICAALMALMTHYSAIFALGCIGAAGAINLFDRRKSLKPLYLWIAANGFLVLYFGYIYLTEIRHNAYEAGFLINSKIASESEPYNSLFFRIELFVAYIFATASYFLHSSFDNQLNIFSALLFTCALIGNYISFPKKNLFWETLFALSVGGLLLAANIYPYAFRIAGRHAMWALPYIILPVSIFLAHIARRIIAELSDNTSGTPKWVALTVMIIVATGGVLINYNQGLLDDVREHQLTRAQMQKLNAFFSELTSEDIVITGSLNMMYLLDDDVDYYRALLKSTVPSSHYYSATKGNVRLLYTKFYPPIVGDRYATLREAIMQLENEGALKSARMIWIFNTGGAWWNVPECKSVPTQTISFYHSGYETKKDAKPIVELTGISYETIKHDILPLHATPLEECKKSK